MQVRRIGPDGAFVREFTEVRKRVESLESRPAGEQFISQSLTTRDPVTGVETVFGQLADGTFGIQPFVGDVTPPPIATKPVVSAQPGTITIQWDGKFAANADKPRDFEHVNVIGYKIVGGNDVLSLTVGVIRLKTDFAFVTTDVIPLGETWQFALQSEDYNGNTANAGPRSDTVTMLSVMDDSIISDALQAIADDNQALSDRVDTTQDSLSDAQALADALLAKGQNLAINGDFDAPLVAGKPVVGWPTLSLSSVQVTASAARTGTQFLRSAPTASPAFGYTNDVTSASGRTYRAEYWVKLGQTAAVTDATATVGFYFTTTKLDGSTNTSPQADTTVSVASLSTSAWTKVTRDYTVNSAVSKIKFGPRTTGNGNVYFVDSFKVTDVTDALSAQLKADSAFANAQQAADAAGTAQTSADNKNKNWYTPTAPAGVSHKDGDTWFDTDDDNRIYVWNATTNQWVDMRDKAIASAAAAATGAKATADGKNTSLWGPTSPTGGTYKDGDLFFNTAEGNKMYLYKAGIGWVGFQDAAISAANQAATGAQASASGKNTNYYSASAPTTGTYKDGDTWFDIANGNRVNIRQGGAWVTIQDVAIKAANTAATGAQATADNKNKNYYGISKPTGGVYKDGDQWFDTDDGNKLYLWKTASNDWIAFQDAAIASLNVAVTAAKASADGKTTTYYQPAQPSGGTYIKGDIWIDTDDNYKMYMYPGTGTTWVSVQDSNAALTAANGKNKSTMAGTAPSSPITGDIWIDTANGNQIKTWSGTAWSDARDVSIAAAAAAATAAQSSANGKNTVYYQTAMPTGGTYRTGDTWFDTDDGNKIYVHNGTTFVNAQDASIATAKGVADSKTKTFIAGSAPTATTVGDIWIDTANGNVIKTWEGSSWVSRADTAISAAAAAATAAQSSASGKNTTYYQTTMPTGGTYRVGDTWFDTDDGNKVYVHNGTTFIAAPFGTNAIANQAITNAQIFDATIQAAKIGSVDAGTISVGTLNAARIAANTIGAEKLLVGDFTNLTDGGNFDTATDLLNWIVPVSTSIVTTLPYSGTGCLQVDANAAVRSLTLRNKPSVKAGEKYWVSYWFKSTADWNGSTGNSKFRFGDQNSANIGQVIYSTASTTWVEKTQEFTVPAGVTNLTLTLMFDHTVGTVWIDSLSMRRKNGGELLVDGTIQAGSAIIATGAIGTAQIGDAQITNAQIANATIQAAKIGSVDAGTITVGTLDANRIGAKTIAVDKLNIGSTDNLINEPTFLTGGSQWITGGAYSIDPTGARNGGPAWKIANAASQQGAYNKPNYQPAEGGQAYRVLAWVKSDVSIPVSGVSVYVTTKNAAGATSVVAAGKIGMSSQAVSGIIPANTWVSVEGKRTLPADAVAVNFGVYSETLWSTGNLWVDFVSATRMANGSLIVDGSIVAGSAIIADGAIDNAQITNATITSAKISEIDAGKIQSGFIDAQRIDAGSISANKLAVGDFANLLDDPSFEAGPVKSPWIQTGGALIQTDSGRNNTMVLRSNAGRTAAIVGTLNNVRLATNDSFIFRMWLYINVTTTAAGQIKVLGQYKNKAGTVVNTATLFSVPSGTTSGWRMYESSPAVKITDASIETMTVQLSVDTAYTGAAIFDDLEVRRQTGATLIEQGSITTGHVTSTGLDAGAISAGTITALQIQSGAITADKMLLTSFDNLVENGNFEYGMANWPAATNWSLDTTNGRLLPNCLKVTGITVRSFGPTSNAYVPIEAGDNDSYRLSGWVKTTATSGDVAELCMYYYDANKGFISNSNYVIPTASTTSTWAFFSKLFVPPAGVAYFRVRPNATLTNAADIMYFDDISVVRAMGADLIVDGAITTQHMTSGTIDAGVLTAGSIKAVQLGAKSITADKLLISSTDNIIQEGNFVGSGIHWTIASDQVPNTGWTWSATAGRNSTPALNVANTAVKQESWNAVATSYTNGVPTKTRYEYTTDGSNAFRVSAWVKSTVTIPVSGAMINVQYKTSAGAVTYAFVPYVTPGTTTPATIAANTWTEITGMVTTPVDNVSIAFGIQSAATLTSGTLTWDSVTATRASNGELIVDGTILTQHLKSGSIDAGVLSANSITTAQMGAGSITAEKLTVGLGTNLIPDPGFLNDGVSEMRRLMATGTQASANPTTGNFDWYVPGTGNNYFRPTGVNQSASVLKSWIPVTPGEKYAFSVDITLPTGATGDIRITGRTKDGVSTTPAFSTLVSFPTLAAGNNTPTYFAEVPAGIYWMLPEIRVSGAIGTVNIAPNSLSLRLRAVGDLIVDGAITGDKITAGAIDASKLSANSVTASAVASKSITADKLIISSTNNILIEPDFGLNGISWTSNANISINATAGRGSTPALRVTGTASAVNIYNLVAKGPDVTNKIAVDSDNRFRASFWVKSTEALPVNAVKIAYRRYTTGTAQTAQTMVGNDAVLVPNTWTQFQAISPALGSTVIACDFYIIVDNLTSGGITDIDAVSVTRASDGKLVVDGAIDGMTITGALIQTSNTPATGSAARGVKLDVLGLRAYNNAGSATFTIDAATGAVGAIGGFQTGSTVSGILMDDNVFQSKPGIRFYTGTGESYLPAIFAADYSSVTYSPGQLVVMGTEQTANSSGRTELKLEPKGGGFRLGTIYGPYDDHGITLNSTGGVAINATDFTLNADTMRLKGKAPDTHTATDTIVYGAGAKTQSTSGTYTIVYPAPVTSGWRRVWCQMDGVSPNGVSFVTQSLTATQFKLLYTSPANNNLSFNYQAVWMP